MKRDIYYLLKRVNKETKAEEFMMSEFNEQTHNIDYYWVPKDGTPDKYTELNVLHYMARKYKFEDDTYDYLIVKETAMGNEVIDYIEQPIRDKHYW